MEIKNRRLEAAEAELKAAKASLAETTELARKANGEYNSFMAKMEGVDFAFWTDEQKKEFQELRSNTIEEAVLSAVSYNVFNAESRVRAIKDAIARTKGLFKQIATLDAELEKLDGELAKAYEDRNFDQLLKLQAQRKDLGAKRWAMIQTLAEVYGYEPKELEKLVSAYDFATGKRPEEAKKETSK